MRTLKKTLALVLVLAMMFSLCVTASAADFEDAAEIENAQAVSTLVGLGVIEGMPDGSFDPAGTLTRAQAAKIIAYLLGVGEYAADGAATGFTDVPASHWASGYIAYCVEEGIIDGYGDGKFGPSDTLTGYQWSKMLLCAAGFKSDIEGYTGSAWQVNVAKDAVYADLWYGADDLNNKDYISRDNACLYAYNTVMGSAYAYSPAVVGDKVIYTLATAGDFDKTNLAVDVKETLTETDALGRPIVVVTGDDQTTSKDDAKPAVYYSGNVAPVLTYTKQVKLSAVAADLGLSGSKAAKLDNAEITRATTGYLANSGNGVTIEVYVAGLADAKGVVPYKTVTIYEYIDVLAKNDIIEAKDATATTDAVKAAIKLDGAKVPYETADFAEKDVVIYNIGKAVVDGVETTVALNVAKAEVVTGNVTAKGDGYVKVNGEKYELAAGVADTTEISAIAQYNFYLDSMGFIKKIAAVDSTVVGDLVYVVDHYTTTEKVTGSYGYEETVKSTYVQAVNMAGEEVSYLVMVDSSNDDKDAGQAFEGLEKTVAAVTYDTTNKVYKFAADSKRVVAVPDGALYNADPTAKQPISFTAAGSNYYFNEAKVVNVINGLDKLAVADSTLKAAEEATSTAYAVFSGKTANKTISQIFFHTEKEVVEVEMDYAIAVLDDTILETSTIVLKDEAGKEYVAPTYTYEVYINGEKTEITTYEQLAQDFYAYAIDENEIYKVAELDGMVAQIENIYGNYVTVGGFSNYDVSGLKIVDLSADEDGELNVGDTIAVYAYQKLDGTYDIPCIYIIDATAIGATEGTGFVKDMFGDYYVSTQAGLETALDGADEGATVTLSKGEYVLESLQGTEDLTITGSADAVVSIGTKTAYPGEGPFNALYLGNTDANVTLKGITLDAGNNTTGWDCAILIGGNYTGTLTIDSCTFTGDQVAIYMCSGKLVMTNSVVNCKGAAVQFDGAVAANISLSGNTFGDGAEVHAALSDAEDVENAFGAKVLANNNGLTASAQRGDGVLVVK